MEKRVRDIMTKELVRVSMDDTLDDVRGLFEEHAFHHVLVCAEDRLVGVVSDRDLLRELSPFVGALSEQTRDLDTLKKPVHQIMTRKVFGAKPNDSVIDAAEQMLRNDVSCLPVLTEDGRILGIVTSKDIVREVSRPRERG